MRDPASLATLDVLTKAVLPALLTDTNLLYLVTCKAVNLTLEQGCSDGSCFAYVYFGTATGYFGDYQSGFRFGRLGYDLVEHRGLRRFQDATYLCFGLQVAPWTKHIRTCRELLLRAFQIANTAGDLNIAVYCHPHLNTNLIAAGDPLEIAQREVENGLEFARQARFAFVVDQVSPQLALIRTLRGLTVQFGSLNDGQMEELPFERRLAANPGLSVVACWYWIRKLQARFFAGDYSTALEASAKAKPLLWSSPSTLEQAEYEFYSAVARAAGCGFASSGECGEHLQLLASHHKQLETWAGNCPENFATRSTLVGAEIARIEGRELDAQRLYEQAIRSAHANGFVHNEALANELAARFYRARGYDKIAQTYLEDARYCYRRWGADGKVRQLDQLYSNLTEEHPRLSPTATIETPVEYLDLATVIKVSQAVSGEMVLQKLIDMLLRTAVEHAGAGRGVLILPHGDELQIEAEATTEGDAISVRLEPVTVAAELLPESVVHYVMRTQETVLLEDARLQSPFWADPYIAQLHARSILCLALINQGKLIGALYLENNLAPHVFTPSRISALKLLASQAAISLENTRLYSDLRRSEAEQVQARMNLETAFEEIKQLKDRLLHENIALKEEIDHASMFEEIVGVSPALKAVLSRVAKVAPTDSTVLLLGETGTGKELIARAIHKRSRRSSSAFVAVNCAAVPDTLIASELFGHEKGAFTGASERRIGRFELADEGTLFLDEVGEIPRETQVMLLRVLQERQFERVGGKQILRANVRVIAATNRDLEAAIAAGTFRSDLFYRLNVIPIEIPPLRDRKEDIPLLVEYFIGRFARKAGKRYQGINKSTLDLLLSYSWPGNIRELQNVVERSVIVCDTENFIVDQSWLSRRVDRAHQASHTLLRMPTSQEKKAIEDALAETQGRVAGPSGAAERLGIPASTLDSKIKALKINKHKFKKF